MLEGEDGKGIRGKRGENPFTNKNESWKMIITIKIAHDQKSIVQMVVNAHV